MPTLGCMVHAAVLLRQLPPPRWRLARAASASCPECGLSTVPLLCGRASPRGKLRTWAQCWCAFFTGFVSFVCRIRPLADVARPSLTRLPCVPSWLLQNIYIYIYIHILNIQIYILLTQLH